MPKFGLALSGGGFRGTFYHLGVIRFLRDAGILHDVTHITSVSGGSILAAHLVLNWNRYNGANEDFDEAARDVLNFAGLDIRNRIIRRIPLLVFGQIARWLTRRPFDRKFTRTGLLERYYRKHLYGDTCLYELPRQPELHILATNLSEGCIASFTRTGLIMERRRTGDVVEFEQMQSGLATVPLAVASSSSFPGFFPPLTVHSSDIGASKSAFSVLSFTDGGVFDNLGVRAFRFIQHCWSEKCREQSVDERETKFVRVGKTGSTGAGGHNGASAEQPEDTGYGHRSEERSGRGNGHAGARHDVSRRADLPRGRDSAVAEIDADVDDDPLDQSSGDLRVDQGQPLAGDFDAVIASDAGAKLSSSQGAFQGGLVRTAMRASDILMDRVWQLEREIFGATPGFFFASIHNIIEPEEDPHALLPVVQRQVIGIRTDLDRFSTAEIRSLVQHGYCVARQVCRARPDIFGENLPDGPPWDPFPGAPTPVGAAPGRPSRPPAEATVLARELQQSALRRVVSTLLDRRDAMTYLFLPFVLAIILFVPSLIAWSYIHVHRDGEALRTIASTDQDAAKMIDLVRDGPLSSIEGMPIHEVDRLDQPDYRGFDFLADGHIVDARRRSRVYQYRRFLVQRQSGATDADPHLRLQFTSGAKSFSLRSQNESLRPVLRRAPMPPAENKGRGTRYRYELDFDFSAVPADTAIELTVEGLSTGEPEANSSASQMLPHTVHGDTKITSMWVLLAERRPAGRFELIAAPASQPGSHHVTVPTRSFEALGGRVFGWQIVKPEPDTTYEGHWLLE